MRNQHANAGMCRYCDAHTVIMPVGTLPIPFETLSKEHHDRCRSQTVVLTNPPGQRDYVDDIRNGIGPAITDTSAL